MAKIDLSHAAQDAAVLHRQDRAVAKSHIEERGRRTELPLAEVKPRPGGDTRALHPHHVLHLAESILAVGLLEPLVVDSKGRLVAGGHRLAALHLLDLRTPEARAERFAQLLEAAGKKAAPDDAERLAALLPAAAAAGAAGEPHPMLAHQTTWPGTPVRMLDFDAEREPDAALAAEAAENTQRKDYTTDEIRSLADRLKGAGFVSKRGRPKPGDKPLIPALAAIVGRHERTILAALSSDDGARGKQAKAATDASGEPAGVPVRRLHAVADAGLAALAGKRSAPAKRLSEALSELQAALTAYQAYEAGET